MFHIQHLTQKVFVSVQGTTVLENENTKFVISQDVVSLPVRLFAEAIRGGIMSTMPLLRLHALSGVATLSVDSLQGFLQYTICLMNRATEPAHFAC